MKKFVALSMATLMMVSNVFASEISVRLNGNAVEFATQEPVIIEGRTLIPLRGVFEQLGYEISWDNGSKTATFVKDDTEVKVTVNKSEFSVNGESVSLDVPAQIVNGSMMLPLRAVGEATGLEVNWDNDTKTVDLTSGEEDTESEFHFDNGKNEETTVEVTTETTTAVIEKVEQEPLSAEESKFVDQYMKYNRALLFCISYSHIISSYSGEIYDLDFNYENDTDKHIEENNQKANEILNEAIAVNESAINDVSNIYSDTITSGYLNNFRTLAKLEGEFCKMLLKNYNNDSVKFKFNDDVNLKVKAINSAYTKLNTEMDNASQEFAEIYAPWDWSYSELSADEKAEVDAYAKKVGEILKNNLSADGGLDSMDSQGVAKAATNIKEEISSIYLPEKCRIDNAMLIKATDVLIEYAERISDDNEYDDVYVSSLIMTFDLCAKNAARDNYVSMFFD